MQSRTRTVASALVVALAVAAIPALAGDDAARGAGDCLAKPRDDTPAGSHWRYRVDHATHRNCWYLKDERARQDAGDGGTADAAAASPDRSADASPRDGAPQADEAIPAASANARAELLPDPPRPARPRPSAAAEKPDPAAVQPAAAQPAASAGVAAQGGRDPSMVRVSDAAPAADTAAAPAPVDAALDDAELAPSVRPAAAPAPRADDPNEPMRVFLGLLLIGAGTCVLAGCAVFHFLYGGVQLASDAVDERLTGGVG